MTEHWSPSLFTPTTIVGYFLICVFLHDHMRRQSLFSLFIFFSFHCVLGLGPASSDIQYLIGYNHGSFVVEKHRLSQGVFGDLSLISFFPFSWSHGWHDA